MGVKVLLLTFLLPLTLAHAQDSWKDVYRESAWEDRDRWQKAEDIIKQLLLTDGSRVADIGSHEGYLAVKLAKVVGLKGLVYAVDIEQSKLDQLATNLESRNITNVIPVKGEHDNPKLLGNLDAVVILDTYHEMTYHDEILRHVKTALKPGGRLVLCEAIAAARRKSARPDQEKKHELGMQYALDDLKKAGFTILRQVDPFVDRSKEKGDKMWLIVAKK